MFSKETRQKIAAYAVKNRLHKIPRWVIVLLIVVVIFSAYQIYNEVLYLTGAYQGCSDCSR